MAGLIKRPGATSWVAIIKDAADSRKQCRKSTFIPITQAGKKEAQTRKEAQAVADGYEAVYRGRILYTAQADIFRRQAGTSADEQRALNKRLDVLRELGSAGGTARKMPTVREFLTTFTPKGKAQNVSNAQRAYARFLEHLGRDADMRLDRLTREHIQAFVDSEGPRVRHTTIGQYRTHISTALNAAINAELLVRNPAHGVTIAPDAEEPIRREAFTPAEIAKIYHSVPQEWKDIVLFCVSTSGQRIGDCVQARWKSIDTAASVIRLQTEKTHNWMEFPLLEPLKSRLAALWAEREPGEEYIFPYFARRHERSKGILSGDFIRLIQACGISTVKHGSTKGDRRQVHDKTFHSFRRSFVSILRDNGASPDMCRAMVGHSSEEVERAYYRANIDDKRKLLSFLFDTVGVLTPTAPVIPPTAPDYRRQA